MRRAGLAAASLALRAATRVRLALHRAGLLATVSLPAPVVCVGNLAAGGTGKTPLVEHVVRELRALGARPAVLARGYGRSVGDTGLNDEGVVLAENLPGLVQRQDPDRVAAGRRVLAAGTADAFVLDDGFQHFRLARDLDIVTLSALDMFGGLRREGPGALRRAGAVVVTGLYERPEGMDAPAIGIGQSVDVRAEVGRYAPGIPVAMTTHEPVALVPLGGGPEIPLESLRGRRVVSAAGIASPHALAFTLDGLGASVQGSQPHPDHGLTSLSQLAWAFRMAEKRKADLVVVTQKDAVKLAASGGGSPPVPVASLRIRIRFLSGEEDLRAALRAALDRGRRRSKP